MRTVILSKLEEIERAYNIRILYACESGSRGWQFPSPDSDYDVRFIYIRPVTAYLSVAEKEGQISLPISDDLDIYGWDLRKVLQLLRKSNATPFEWMQSPIVYREEAGFRKAFCQLLPLYFDAKTNACHYMGLVRKMAGEQDMPQTMTIKALFYIIRSLLAASWCVKKNEIAPLTIDDLMVLLPHHLQLLVKELIALKSVSVEKLEIAVDKTLADFINAAIANGNEAISRLNKKLFEAATLDAFFIKTMGLYDNQGYKRGRPAVAGMY